VYNNEKSPFDEKRATEKFIAVCETWKDDRTVEEQMRGIHESRGDQQQ